MNPNLLNLPEPVAAFFRDLQQIATAARQRLVNNGAVSPIGYTKAVDANAAATLDQPFYVVPDELDGLVVDHADLALAAASAADPNNYATVTVERLDSTYANPVTLFSATSSAVAIPAGYSAMSVVGSITQRTLPKHTILRAHITKTGTGVVVAQGRISVH